MPAGSGSVQAVGTYLLQLATLVRSTGRWAEWAPPLVCSALWSLDEAWKSGHGRAQTKRRRDKTITTYHQDLAFPQQIDASTHHPRAHSRLVDTNPSLTGRLIG